MVYSNVNEALGALDRKVEVLNNLVLANDFLVSCMREEAERLHVMGGDETREMLRERARAKFRQNDGEEPNPAVLSILEQALGNGHTAEIIPFPREMHAG
ncbi:hypothetical protein KMP13_09610 [Epibacterium ulvae]|uniref:hypothetical protein n=1 Tax=Epibacterium ulvae TaxID=1156985 RepID=UPI001BFCAC5B|nr:hypothetical protein [Epibacterium ulvae]MBT8154146.1 hypothetical protein [Epibacterium ulvae]